MARDEKRRPRVIDENPGFFLPAVRRSPIAREAARVSEVW
jgi:hypothetical protein